MHRITLGGAAALAVFAGAGSAWAQDPQMQPITPGGSTITAYDVAPSGGVVAAPKRAFEIGLSAGYTQPWGEIARNRPIEPVAGPGFSPALELGYRFSPHWSLGVAGQYHESAVHDALANGSHVRGFAVNVDGTYHFMPYRFIDPYAQIGFGYRALWELPPGSNDNLAIHGFELGRLQVGIDYRVSKDVALGPYVAADLNLFAWQHQQDATRTVEITEKRTNTFLSAGIMARFDVGGSRVPVAQVAVVQPAYFEARVAPTPAKPPSAPHTTGITFEAEILQRCSVGDEKAFFEFDSANLEGADAPTLDQVAKCLTTGALKDREVIVVGRADPRGPRVYNQKLGQSRADAVRSYLVGRGVRSGDVMTVSRGEEGATGTDETGWAYDRRVDIRLKR